MHPGCEYCGVRGGGVKNVSEAGEGVEEVDYPGGVGEESYVCDVEVGEDVREGIDPGGDSVG